MKTTVDSGQLKKAATWIWQMQAKTIGRNVPSRIILTAGSDRLHLTICDRQHTVTTAIPASTGEPGAAHVDGKQLTGLVRTLGAKQQVDLAVDGTLLAITVGPARFTTPCYDPTLDTPQPLPPTVTTIDRQLFAEAVGQAAHAAGNDNTLPVLTNLHLHSTDGQLTVAATDRYQLAARTIDHTPAGDSDWAALLPAASTVAAVKRLTGPSISLHADNLNADFEAVIAVSDGTSSIISPAEPAKHFPPYQKLLHPGSPLTADVNRTGLQAAVRAAAAGLKSTVPVSFEFADNTVTLTAGSSTNGQNRTGMPAEYDGPKLTVALNPTYLLAALAAIPGPAVRFGFASATDMKVVANKPVMLGDPTLPDLQLLIMTIRVYS